MTIAVDKSVSVLGCCLVGMCVVFAASSLASDSLPATLDEESSVIGKGFVEGEAKGDSRLVDVASDVESGEAATSEAEVSNDASSEAVLPTAESINLSDVVPEVAPVPLVPAAPAPLEQSRRPLKPILQDKPPAPTLVLLGAKVPPATSTRLSWMPEQSFAGIAVPTPVLVVHGASPGPTLCLTGAVHGDELNGVEIVRQVMYELDPQKLSGTLIGIPIVNLQGFRRGTRYLPDRRDLNRYFPGLANGSSASRIAYSLFEEVIRRCDFLVDIHTASFKRTNLPQLRADLKRPEVTELVEHMGAMVVLHSQGARGSLRRAATEYGVPAVTIEAGEPHIVQKDAVKEGVKSIHALMHQRDMYPRRGLWARTNEPVFYKSRWVRVPKGGILISSILLGARVKEGEVLGTVTDPITNQATDIHSPISGRVIGMAVNQVMRPGYAGYHLGYQSTIEEASEQDVGPDDSAGDEAPSEQAEPTQAEAPLTNVEQGTGTPEAEE